MWPRAASEHMGPQECIVVVGEEEAAMALMSVHVARLARIPRTHGDRPGIATRTSTGR